jgi:hypothetical protein
MNAVIEILRSDLVSLSAISLFPVHSIIFILWSLIWKGWALWRASQKGSKAWFIVLLFVNTVGILDMLYLFVFSKMKPRGESKPTTQQ